MDTQLLFCIFWISQFYMFKPGYSFSMTTDELDLAYPKEKVCNGTDNLVSRPSNREQHYRNLRDRYTNCTLVDGNLELTWLFGRNLDLSFLEKIQEVTGYILISHLEVEKFPEKFLPRLEIVHGRKHFKPTLTHTAPSQNSILLRMLYSI